MVQRQNPFHRIAQGIQNLLTPEAIETQTPEELYETGEAVISRLQNINQQLHEGIHDLQTLSTQTDPEIVKLRLRSLLSRFKDKLMSPLNDMAKRCSCLQTDFQDQSKTKQDREKSLSDLLDCAMSFLHMLDQSPSATLYDDTETQSLSLQSVQVLGYPWDSQLLDYSCLLPQHQSLAIECSQSNDDLFQERRALMLSMARTDKLRQTLNAYKKINQFKSMVNMDLRTSFNGFVGFMTILQDGCATDLEEEKEFLNEGHQSLRDTLGLLQKRYLWGQFWIAPIALSLKPIPSGDVAAQAKQVFKGLQRKYKHLQTTYTVVLPVSDAPIFFYGDRKSLAQIIWNLIENATRSTYRGGQVTVKIEVMQPLKVAQISVINTGQGFLSEDRDKILKPFAPEDCLVKRTRACHLRFWGDLNRFDLTIVQQLLGAMGSTLKIYSEGKDAGAMASFSVHLYEPDLMTESSV